MHEDNELDAYRSSYIKVAQAAVKAIEACPAAISSGTPAGDSATVALLELAAALEESKATILKALSHG
ncbi:hypothetical protein [Pantoea sp. 18069]|uniref:hypothetical protein n=1 Tax=Pantoea sp. 18069 TaxID=2681415 RepID=UPI001F475915|nr:hypothetical protein [Pantoea sp. 18069]